MKRVGHPPPAPFGTIRGMWCGEVLVYHLWGHCSIAQWMRCSLDVSGGALAVAEKGVLAGQNESKKMTIASVGTSKVKNVKMVPASIFVPGESKYAVSPLAN